MFKVMRNFLHSLALDATPASDESACCYSSGREICDGNWFAWIKYGGSRVVFCRPWCGELFLEAAERQTDSTDKAQRGSR